jgi:hypothetical protein
MPDAQTEIKQLKLKVERLQRELDAANRCKAIQQPLLPQFITSDSLLKDQNFIEDMARFADGVLTEKQVRQKYHLFDESTWVALNDDALVEAIELERTRRIRSGATKRELAQNHVIAAPGILNGIMTNPKESARHRLDASKILDQFADPGAQAAHDDVDRVRIVINLGADTKANGQEINPADVLVIDTAVRPNPNPSNDKIIDSWNTPKQLELNQKEPLPPKRGPGRPKGSRNKPKNETTPQELLPFVAAKRADGGGSGEPL